MASYLFEDDRYEFIYGEAAGPPYSPSIMRTEENRRKLIRFLRRSKKSFKKKIQMNFMSIFDEEVENLLENISRFGMLTSGTSLKIIYYDTPQFEIGRILQLINVKVPLKFGCKTYVVKNYLLGLLIFRRGVLEFLKCLRNLENLIERRMNVSANILYIPPLEPEDDVFPSPMKKIRLNY